MRKLAAVYSRIQHYQKVPYILEPLNFISEYLQNAIVMDEMALYALSLKIEPKM